MCRVYRQAERLLPGVVWVWQERAIRLLFWLREGVRGGTKAQSQKVMTTNEISRFSLSVFVPIQFRPPSLVRVWTKMMRLVSHRLIASDSARSLRAAVYSHRNHKHFGHTLSEHLSQAFRFTVNTRTVCWCKNWPAKLFAGSDWLWTCLFCISFFVVCSSG